MPPKRKLSKKSTAGAASKNARVAAPARSNKRSAAARNASPPAKKRRTGLDEHSIVLPQASQGRVLRSRVITSHTTMKVVVPKSSLTPIVTVTAPTGDSSDTDEGEASSSLTDVSEAPFSRWEANRAASRMAWFGQTSSPYDSNDFPVDDGESEADEQNDQEWDTLDDITEQPEGEHAVYDVYAEGEDEADLGDDEAGLGEDETDSREDGTDPGEHGTNSGEDETVSGEEDTSSGKEEEAEEVNAEGDEQEEEPDTDESDLVEVDENDLTDYDVENTIVITRNNQDGHIGNTHEEYVRSVRKPRARSQLSTPVTLTQDDAASIFSEEEGSATPTTEEDENEIEAFAPSHVQHREEEPVDTQRDASGASSVGLVDQIYLSQMNEAARNPKVAPEFSNDSDAPAYDPENPLEDENRFWDTPPLASRPDSDEWYFLPAIRDGAQAMIGLRHVLRKAGGTSSEALQPYAARIMSLLQRIPPIFMKETFRLTKEEKVKLQRLDERVRHQMMFLQNDGEAAFGPEDLWNLEMIAKYGAPLQ